MTNQPNHFTPADMRRALALMCHYQAGDAEGLAAIWAEAAESDSWPDLAAATMAAVFEICPVLRTPEGGRALREVARAYAAAEAAEGTEGEPS